MLTLWWSQVWFGSIATLWNPVVSQEFALSLTNLLYEIVICMEEKFVFGPCYHYVADDSLIFACFLSLKYLNLNVTMQLLSSYINGTVSYTYV